MKKVVRINLTDGNLVSVMQHEIDQYKKAIKQKCEDFVKALTDRGVEIASVKFGEAIYAGTNDVTVDVQTNDKLSRAVVATGEATLFIEFGTGILYPDDHPESASTAGVVPRGTYGDGKGSNPNGWTYVGDPGTGVSTSVIHYKSDGRQVVKTYGSPANKSLYLTREELRRDWESIARRIFA